MKFASQEPAELCCCSVDSDEFYADEREIPIEGEVKIEDGPVVSQPSACVGCGKVVRPSPAIKVSIQPGSGSKSVGLTMNEAIPDDEVKVPIEISAPDDSGSGITIVQKPPSPAATMRLPRSGAATDYSWIQGKLTFVHLRGGAWVLRYLPLDQTDSYGGSVVLARDSRLNRFREGDVVRVHGEILTPRANAHLGGALYRVDQVELIVSAPVGLD